ncbi:MAG: alpha-isopropylmalate/homocitrate synthase transferase, 2-isopropylmalate synthase [Chloroflexi bacterium CSP1-4]|nr:MAG: alpha-isopropylmalate/homocitrate synthase transferase, 2-isopropylmalate synthase [Chloroflexi bacterium CSP1-4]
MTDPILLYDTTLRDGTQREGMVLSLADKVRIARRLDEAGFPYVEGGWPGSNPKDVEFFEAAKGMTWQNARIAAFGSTRHRSNRPEADPNLQALVAAGTPVVTIFGKSWLLHVTEVLGATADENLAMVGDSVAFCGQGGREVVYDAEHFFDGYKADRAYALATLRAAHDAGASTLVLCDTNGGCITDQVTAIVRDVMATLDLPARYGIHVHDDAGLAVANSIAAVQAGVRHVQGTINGYGERCGNANIVTVWADLALKMGRATVPAGADLSGLAELSRYVAGIANITPDAHAPYVGASAFAHKGGVHGAATARVRHAYQHVDPALVGNETRLVVSELGGRVNTQWRAEQLGHELEGVVDPRELSRLIKQLESEGASFEGAEASFELLIRRHQKGYQAPFRLLDFTVFVEQRDGRDLRAEATVKVEVEGEVLHTAADGNGPVNALDSALRKALRAFYPQLDGVHLVDYKVRILDGDAATAAKTRVVIDSASEWGTWSTGGADTNIIAASWQALGDSLEYALWKSGAQTQRRDERHFTTIQGDRP